MHVLQFPQELVIHFKNKNYEITTVFNRRYHDYRMATGLFCLDRRLFDSYSAGFGRHFTSVGSYQERTLRWGRMQLYRVTNTSYLF